MKKPRLRVLWVSNLWPAKLYNAASGHIGQLSIYLKNYAVILTVRYTTYSEFYTYGPQTDAEQLLWPFAKSGWKRLA